MRDQPFRAARLAPTCSPTARPRVYGLLGIAHSLLGSLRASRDAYEHAVALDPEHPAYRHNLGHLLDAGFNRPKQALVHLSAAFRAAPHEAALASSYAHALARAGQAARAVELLQRSLNWSSAAALAASKPGAQASPCPPICRSASFAARFIDRACHDTEKETPSFWSWPLCVRPRRNYRWAMKKAALSLLLASVALARTAPAQQTPSTAAPAAPARPVQPASARAGLPPRPLLQVPPACPRPLPRLNRNCPRSMTRCWRRRLRLRTS